MIGIVKGWYNYLKGETNDTTIKRSKICKMCDFAIIGTYEQLLPDFQIKEVQGLKCDKCKCPLSTKLRNANEKCPLNKW